MCLSLSYFFSWSYLCLTCLGCTIYSSCWSSLNQLVVLHHWCCSCFRILMASSPTFGIRAMLLIYCLLSFFINRIPTFTLYRSQVAHIYWNRFFVFGWTKTFWSAIIKVVFREERKTLVDSHSTVLDHSSSRPISRTFFSRCSRSTWNLDTRTSGNRCTHLVQEHLQIGTRNQTDNNRAQSRQYPGRPDGFVPPLLVVTRSRFDIHCYLDSNGLLWLIDKFGFNSATHQIGCIHSRQNKPTSEVDSSCVQIQLEQIWMSQPVAPYYIFSQLKTKLTNQHWHRWPHHPAHLRWV